MCVVEDEAALADAFNRLKDANVPAIGYYEDDFKGALTAVATGLLRGEQRRPLRRFRLLVG